jgi:hypothetical protein
MRSMPAILLLAVCLGCWDSADKKKDEELQTQRLLYLASITPADSMAACVQAETRSLACASQAGLTSSYMAAMRSLFVIPTTNADPSALCTDLQSSVQYSAHSQAARACTMTCYGDFFARQACTSGTFGTTLAAFAGCTPYLLTSCTDSALVSCINSCLRTGTVLF